uniref:Uncharacterized protein n=1 Tax=Acrobeloides nanus TaxID=290746 RepID=A0A914DXS4_9BILA
MDVEFSREIFFVDTLQFNMKSEKDHQKHAKNFLNSALDNEISENIDATVSAFQMLKLKENQRCFYSQLRDFIEVVDWSIGGKFRFVNEICCVKYYKQKRNNERNTLDYLSKQLLGKEQSNRALSDCETLLEVCLTFGHEFLSFIDQKDITWDKLNNIQLEDKEIVTITNHRIDSESLSLDLTLAPDTNNQEATISGENREDIDVHQVEPYMRPLAEAEFQSLVQDVVEIEAINLLDFRKSLIESGVLIENGEVLTRINEDISDTIQGSPDLFEDISEETLISPKTVENNRKRNMEIDQQEETESSWLTPKKSPKKH